MSLYKRGEIWWVKFQHRGEIIRRSSGSASRAKAAQFERRLRQEVEDRMITGKERVQFSRALAEFIQEHVTAKKPQTAKRYLGSCRALRNYFEGFMVDEISQRDVVGFISSRKKSGTGPTGIRHDLAVMAKLMSLCVAKEYTRFNPLRDFDKSMIPTPQNRVRSLTTAEEQKLFAKLPADLAAIAFVALETGMRCGEIISLEHGQIDWENGELTLTKTKSNRPRTIPLTAAARAQLRAQPRHIKSPLVFPLVKPDGTVTPRKVGNVSHQFGKYVADARIKDFRFHDLRHTFATRYLKNRGKVERLQVILGHSTINQTMKYAHVDTYDAHDDLKRVEKVRAQKLAQAQEKARRKEKADVC